MAPKKIRYQSRSVETHVDAPRDAVWERIVAVIRDEVQPAEELSFEPPWRFAYEVDTTDSALAFWQSTVLIRDDGPTCHIAWVSCSIPNPARPPSTNRSRSWRACRRRSTPSPPNSPERRRGTDSRVAAPSTRGRALFP